MMSRPSLAGGQGNRTLVLRWSNDCVDRSVGKSLCEDCEDLGVQANGV